MKRNYNIDFFRGIAVLSVALIHTAWHSGVSYVPLIVRSLTLLIDVPVFIFISGMTFYYHKSLTKNINGVINLWKNWLFFLLFYILIIFLFDRGNLNSESILNWSLFTFTQGNILNSVGWSIWFVPMYIKVTLFSGIIISSINKFCLENEEKILKSIVLLFLFLFLYIQQGNSFLFFDREILAYSILYILGYLSMNYKIDSIKKLMIIEIPLLIIIYIMFAVTKHSMYDLQNLKAPIHMTYLFLSFVGITFMLYLKEKINIKEKNLIANIGKNAIFFYFAQGVSSSILFRILPYIKIDTWYIKFLVMFVINLVMAYVFATILKYSYGFVKEKFNKIFTIIKNKKVNI